ncbi:aspartate aminotransferase family protein [Mycobacteroides abscessus]
MTTIPIIADGAHIPPMSATDLKTQDLTAMYYPVSEQKMVAGEGVYLYDDAGRSYIDCGSATFNLSLGYQHPAVTRAIKNQADELIHITSGFQTKPIVELASRLVELAPKRLTKAHLKVSGGSTANEGAIKMAQLATGRRDVVTMFRSHLGQTMTMAGLSGNAFRKTIPLLSATGGLQVPDPYCLRCFYGQRRESCALMCVDRIHDFLEFASSGSVAAVMVEPISGNGGNIVPPDGYFTKLRELCDEHDIKLIFDEVQTGIGRTGYMFAAEYFQVDPDAMTIGKGLGGSGAQVAGILASDELAGLPANNHSFTYGANLVSAAAALATLDVIAEDGFLANVRTTGAHILERCNEMARKFPWIADVRGVGLMIGIEVVDDYGRPSAERANRLADQAMDHGLVIRTSRYGRGNVIKIRPPLTLTLTEADLICDRLGNLFRDHAR